LPKQREEEQRDKEPSSSKKQSKKIILLSAKKRLREIRLEGVVLLQSIATLSSSIPIATHIIYYKIQTNIQHDTMGGCKCIMGSLLCLGILAAGAICLWQVSSRYE